MIKDNISDEELRTKLKSYGATSIGPITQSTRSVYLKKLQKLMNEKSEITINEKKLEDTQNKVPIIRKTRYNIYKENNENIINIQTTVPDATFIKSSTPIINSSIKKITKTFNVDVNKNELKISPKLTVIPSTPSPPSNKFSPIKSNYKVQNIPQIDLSSIFSSKNNYNKPKQQSSNILYPNLNFSILKSNELGKRNALFNQGDEIINKAINSQRNDEMSQNISHSSPLQFKDETSNPYPILRSKNLLMSQNTLRNRFDHGDTLDDKFSSDHHNNKSWDRNIMEVDDNQERNYINENFGNINKSDNYIPVRNYLDINPKYRSSHIDDKNILDSRSNYSSNPNNYQNRINTNQEDNIDDQDNHYISRYLNFFKSKIIPNNYNHDQNSRCSSLQYENPIKISPTNSKRNLMMRNQLKNKKNPYLDYYSHYYNCGTKFNYAYYFNHIKSFLSRSFHFLIKPSNLQNILSVALVLGLILLLSSAYYNFKDSLTNQNMIQIKGEKKFACSGNDQKCIMENEHIFVVKLVRLIYDLLSKRAGRYQCSFINLGPKNYSIDDILLHLKAKYPGIPKFQMNEYLVSAIKMMMDNPHWGINLADKSGYNSKIKLPTAYDVYWLESARPYIPLWCSGFKGLGYLLSKIFSYSLILIFLSLLGFVSFKFICYKRRQNEKVYQMIRKALDIVMKNDEAYKNSSAKDTEIFPYIAISHVRDMLIPPNKRQELRSTWTQVLYHMNNDDSRIRVEAQTIHGELFEVWKWIPHYHHIEEENDNGKLWQGPANDVSNQYGSQGLTQCLKIRNMFDKNIETGYEWPDRVKDAILEKCGPNANIVHMVIDQESPEGCVYVKCGTSDAAGATFTALHGWWYGGNLIAVKYLRLQRYNERFPDSINANAPLRPHYKY